MNIRDVATRRGKVWAVVAGVVVLAAGASYGVVSRNVLSQTTILGHWKGYTFYDGSGTVTKEPLDLTFRADGTALKFTRVDANYEVCRNAIVFYNIRARNGVRHPVLWDASLVGDTLKISGGEDSSVLTRVR